MPQKIFAEVAFPLPMGQTFTYEVPESGDENLVGRRVLVPFGKKQLTGYVVNVASEKPRFPTKPIHTFIDPEPLLSPVLIELAEWLSKTYLCSLGEALAAILPAQLKAPKRLRKDPDFSLPPEAKNSGSFPRLTLSLEQEKALSSLLATIAAKRFEAFLLRGITDSGKTELYLRAIDAALAQGQQAIFLLPEIALTPPFIKKLEDRYSSEIVGVWHSGISAGERYRIWQGARTGQLKVILGARSAVFSPLPALGVIVMDEEHEPSYKQEDRPRYHTREVALWRAKKSGAALIMGSATPSLESYWAAKQGTYTLLELTSRVEQKELPPVTLVDRRQGSGATPPDPRRRRSSGFSIFSEPLKLAMEQALARREQILLFVNRRGFTPFLRCGTCGWVARCSKCSTTLAMHVKKDAEYQGKAHLPIPADAVLRCHACLQAEKVPTSCPACKGMKLRQYGVGTQRVEEEIKQLFPFVKLARMDHDVAGQRHIYEKIYNDFASRKLDLLVGTQMIAKGFDFPHVSVVGVIDADVSLHLPDFRAAERTFQLVTQVAGRTGRGDRPGQVLVQTHYPEHSALRAAQTHDFVGFYEKEIQDREALRYPPFCRLIHVLLRAPKEAAAQKAAEDLAEALQNIKLPLLVKERDGVRIANPHPELRSPSPLQGEGTAVEILGPAPAPYARIRGQYRYQLVIKGNPEKLEPVLEFLRHYRAPKAFMTTDVDPMDLL